MNYDDLKEMLMKKVEQEQFNYKQNLIKNYKPEKIIKEAYKINFREQIIDILDGKMLGRQEIKVLLNHVLELSCIPVDLNLNTQVKILLSIDENKNNELSKAGIVTIGCLIILLLIYKWIDNLEKKTNNQ